jgi:hypothetical protein
MKSGTMTDSSAEQFYQYLTPGNAFQVSEKPEKETNHCIVFCEKLAPNVFNIKKGVAVIEGSGTFFNDGVCMVAPETKIVFVFE